MRKPIVNTNEWGVDFWEETNEKLIKEHFREIKVTGNSLLFILDTGDRGLVGINLYLCIIHVNVCMCVFIFWYSWRRDSKSRTCNFILGGVSFKILNIFWSYQLVIRNEVERAFNKHCFTAFCSVLVSLPNISTLMDCSLLDS